VAGVAEGSPWRWPDGSAGGVFEASLVKVVPEGTFWTACFHPVDPVVDVDIVLPVEWVGGALEEVDLELDVLRLADSRMLVRDEEEFERVRVAWAMPDEIVARARETCERVRRMVEQRVEPFGEVGRGWLERFQAGVGTG
jgi:uncharacterized protein